MRSIKFFTIAACVGLFLSTPTLGQSSVDEKPMTVSERIEMAERIQSAELRSRLAASESDWLTNENEIKRQRIESKSLESRLETSLSEIEQLRNQVNRYEQLLKNNSERNSANQQTRRASPAVSPLNLRVLNILRGDNISTRARVAVIGDDGRSEGEFQVKEGSSVQGWKVESIQQNSIKLSRQGQSFTYGSDGMM